MMLQCPIPLQDHPTVQLAHGGGGRLMHTLIETMFMTAFENPLLLQKHDASVFDVPAGRLAMTTDSYIVRPLVFPGGNIGDLAVNGTLNDLAMSGARPLYLSAGFILEEGLSMATLWDIVCAMRAASEQAQVPIITGDTKVVDKGHGDGVFINTSGVGVIEHPYKIAPQSVQADDVIIVNGDLARHGMAVMAQREGLQFETTLTSDTQNLWPVVQKLLDAGIELHCLRDLTRGGLVSALNEIAEVARHGMCVNETDIPLNPEVQGACEILGLDPLSVASEGRFVLFVAAHDAERCLAILQETTPNLQPAQIGTVLTETSPMVQLRTVIGTTRILDMAHGEPLPRIC